MLKAVLKAARHGVWLDGEEWRHLANTEKRRLSKLVGEVAKLIKRSHTAGEALDIVAVAGRGRFFVLVSHSYREFQRHVGYV
jgi:hypothetical protein